MCNVDSSLNTSRAYAGRDNIRKDRDSHIGLLIDVERRSIPPPMNVQINPPSGRHTGRSHVSATGKTSSLPAMYTVSHIVQPTMCLVFRSVIYKVYCASYRKPIGPSSAGCEAGRWSICDGGLPVRSRVRPNCDSCDKTRQVVLSSPDALFWGCKTFRWLFVACAVRSTGSSLLSRLSYPSLHPNHHCWSP